MEVTTKGQTNQDTNGTEGETKQRKRIDPRVKMVKALHSIQGDHLRENKFGDARITALTLLEYLEQIVND